VLLEVGRVARPHGLQGEVVVALVTTLDERLAPGSALDCGGRQLVVESAQPVPGRAGPTGGRWLVRFVGIASREAAESLAGALLRAEPAAAVPDEALFVHELIGAEVVESSGQSRGTVVAVEANPASDLLVLDSGALVPARFVVASEPGRLTVEVPAGLFEL
jgi:16S rRNA processing protein RimM